MMTRRFSRDRTTAGAVIGAAMTGGPWGASAGAALGEMAAGKAGQSVGEKAALSKWESKLTNVRRRQAVTAGSISDGARIGP